MRPERAFGGAIALAILGAGAATSYGNGNVILGTVFLVLGLLGLLATFANRIPVLHRLPVVGAIRPPERVDVYLADPYEGQSFQMDSGGPEDVVVCVGVPGGRSEEITRVLLNAWVVGARAIVRCLPDGRPYPNGGLQMPAGDSPYWAAPGVTIPLGAFVFFFKVTIPAPGDYPVVFRLQSPDFYDKGDHTYIAELAARFDGDPEVP